MKAIVKPSTLKGDIVAPKSKSIMHRYLICKYLSNALKEETGLCQDTKITYDALSKLSFKKEIYVGGSASTLRFLIPICLAKNIKTSFKLSPSLSKRPFDFINVTFLNKGVKVVKENDIVYIDGQLSPGNYICDTSISSQLVSGLIFALPLLHGDSQINLIGKLASAPYIDMTIEVLSKFNIVVNKDGNKIFIKGNQKYKDISFDIDADFSSMAYYYVLNKMGAEINILNVSRNINQGDGNIVSLLNADSNIYDMKNNIDLSPIIALYLASKKGISYLVNINNLIYKESDRVDNIIKLLDSFSIKSEYLDENEGTIKIYGEKLSPMKEYQSNDHRMLMSAIVGALQVGGTIDGVEEIAKSYPDFINDIKSLGGEVCLIE